MSDAIDAEVGTELPGLAVHLTRETLVRYAGASGDFNPIHYSDFYAGRLGLGSVIAHGMLTMGTALRLVTDWAGDPERVQSYGVRFTKPVPVPDDTDGALVEFAGSVTRLADGVATVSIQATCDGVKVLGSATAEVRVD
ncbi:MaoC/PaaZ C-terminal domain-containing protein [Nigerium massiliense]|uniref:MaoC/PaaZ C-terminal domain-containing protein n=1 Tax=Nigerium massiliense TaxID=1522317 RepID=UPI00058B017B|nr:MaoC/PaaZ C-terminal domain-containing protein [Nigerium massiliense]